MMTSPPTPVYSKSNPAGGASLSPKQKRVLLIVCALVVAAIAAGSIWGAVQSDQYTTAGKGCVTVTLAGSTGGELIHKCGNAAKTLCHSAYVNSDQTSLAIRPACEKAGLTPAKVSTSAG